MDEAVNKFYAKLQASYAANVMHPASYIVSYKLLLFIYKLTRNR